MGQTPQHQEARSVALEGRIAIDRTQTEGHDESTVTARSLGQVGEKRDRATEACSEHIAGSDGEAEPHGVARKATSDDCPDGQCRSRMRRQDGLKCEQLRRIQVLRSLCQEIDPYTPLPSEVRQRLRELGIDAEEEDPFALTNRLLSLMEDALEEFHQLGKGPGHP